MLLSLSHLSRARLERSLGHLASPLEALSLSLSHSLASLSHARALSRARLSTPHPSRRCRPTARASRRRKRRGSRWLVRVAEMLQTGGRAEEALAAIDTALALEPGNLDAVAKRGLCFQALGALHDAYNAYDLDRARAEHNALAGRSKSLRQTYGMLAEAADGFRRSLRTDPGDAPTRHRLAATLTDLGIRVQVLGASARAVAHYRKPRAWTRRVLPRVLQPRRGDVRAGKPRRGAGVLRAGDRVKPEPRRGALQRGRHKKVQRRRDGRDRGVLQRCLAVTAEPRAGAGNLAIARSPQGHGDQGERGRRARRAHVPRGALTLDPNGAEATYNLGVALAEIGELDRATIAYESTLRLRPHCAEAWNNLGVLHRERNNVERAVECYQRAVAINPAFAQPLNNLGVVYTMQGQARMALEALQRAVAAAPTYAVAHNNLGVLLRDTGDVPEALKAYNEVREALARTTGTPSRTTSSASTTCCRGSGARCARRTPRGARGSRRRRADRRGAACSRPGGSATCAGTRARARRMRRSAKAAAEGRARRRSPRGASMARRLRRRLRVEPPRARVEPEQRGRDGRRRRQRRSSRSSKSSKSSKSEGGQRRRLVVGYVSPDMYTHSVSYFAHAPLSSTIRLASGSSCTAPPLGRMR